MKNYISKKGFDKLVDEHTHLTKVERPKTCEVIAWAAGNGDRSENADYIYGKKRLREIDRRLRFLNKRINSAEVVDYLKFTGDKIRFGATVEMDGDEQKVISIVGVDEIELKEGKISWVSPIGKALLNKEVGDEVTIHSPNGEMCYTIENVEYKEW